MCEFRLDPTEETLVLTSELLAVHTFIQSTLAATARPVF